MLWLPVPSWVRAPAAQGCPPIPAIRSSVPSCPCSSRPGGDGCGKLKGGSIKVEGGPPHEQSGVPRPSADFSRGRGLPVGCGIGIGDPEGQREKRGGVGDAPGRSGRLRWGYCSVSLFSSSRSLCLFSVVSRKEGGKSVFARHQFRCMSGLFLVLRQWEGRMHRALSPRSPNCSGRADSEQRRKCVTCGEGWDKTKQERELGSACGSHFCTGGPRDLPGKVTFEPSPGESARMSPLNSGAQGSWLGRMTGAKALR